MTPNQRIKQAQKELNAIADRCRDMAEDLEELADDLHAIPVNEEKDSEPLQGFEAVSRLLHSGQRPALGQIVTTVLADGTVAEWRVIDTHSMAKREETEVTPVIVQLVKILHYRPFSRPDKQRPWGWNNYEASELAAWLDDELAASLTEAERNCIIPRHDLGGKNGWMLWLLSTDEAGFGELDKAFDWYACEEEDERDERRQLQDIDGDPAYWWLHTPSSGSATTVRTVNTDGSLSSSTAVSAYGVSPACAIG